MGCIYKITDTTNNKVYIGQTVYTIKKRWNDHLEAARNAKSRNINYLLYNAMNTHGIDNFIVEEIEQCEDSLLDEREMYWIDKYNSFFRNGQGYNMTIGGNGVRYYSDQQIKKLWDEGYSSIQIATILGANKATIGARLQTIVGENAILQRKTDKSCKAVCQYSLEGELIKIWRSGADAERELHLATGTVSRCCTKQRNCANKSLWKFINDSTTIDQLMYKYASSPTCADVYLVEKGQFKQYFSSAKEAEQILHLTRGKVSEVCNHKYGRKTVGGYSFEWAYPLKRTIVESLNES